MIWLGLGFFNEPRLHKNMWTTIETRIGILNCNAISEFNHEYMNMRQTPAFGVHIIQYTL